MPSTIELGMQAMQDGQPFRAAAFFEFAIKKAPADPALRLLVADAYIQAGEMGRADAHVRVLIDQSEALYKRGEYELLARARAAKAQIDAALVGGAEREQAGAAEVIGGRSVAVEPTGDSPETYVTDGAALESLGAVAPSRSAPESLGAVAPGRPRVMACPWCGRTVLLDGDYAGRCECPWFQPARGSRLYLTDLQRLCADTRSVLLLRLHQDVFALDGSDVRLRLLTNKALKIDPRLAFQLDLGHPLILPDQLLPVLPEQHPTAPFQLGGQFYSFAELLDRIEIEYPDALCLLPRDIHYQQQLWRHLAPDLRQKADEQLAAGARSYGRCLLTAGMTMEDLVRMVPGWQVLRPVGGGHGRLDAVRSLVRQSFVTAEEAADAVAKGRGRDGLDCLVDAKLVDRAAAEQVAAEAGRRKLPVPLRDDIMERLCRRGVISRATLVRAGLVVGLVDAEAGQEADSLAGAMSRIPPGELERERDLLARKEAIRRSERLALGKILVELGFCSRQRVAAALARQVKEDSPLGEMLVRDLAITPEQLTVALCEQEQRLETLLARPPEPERPAPPVTAPLPGTKDGTRDLPKVEPEERKPAARQESKQAGGRLPKKLPPWGLPVAAGILVLAVAGGAYAWWRSLTAMPREYPVDFPIAAPSAARESLIRGAWRDASGSLQASPDLHALAAEVEAAVLARSKNASVLTNGALLRLDEGNIRAALLLARRALELAPDDPYAHVAMGATLLAGGNEYEAGREFQEARELDPLLVVEAAIQKEATGSAVVAKRRVALTVIREADPAYGTSSSSDGGRSKQTSTGSPSTPGASGSGTR